MQDQHHAHHDRADESWYEEEHTKQCSTEEAEHEPDYGEGEVVRSIWVVCNDNWSWSRLRRDHDHILERGEGGGKGRGGKQVRRKKREIEREKEGKWGGGETVEKTNEEVGRQRW